MRSSVPRRTAALLLATGLLIYGLSLSAGLVGVDFGVHWDERVHLDDVRASVARHGVLPTDCRYTSITYDLGLGLAWLTSADGGGHGFQLTYRGVCLAISLLAIFGCGLLAWSLGNGSALTAIAAMAFLGGSWEYGYHARWIAPDTLLASFAGLAFYLTALAWKTRRLVVLGLAAVAAGLAVGTKQSGATMLVPLLLVAVSEPAWRRPTRLALVLGVVASTFVATNPVILFEPTVVVRSLRAQLVIYGERGHFGFTVVPGLEHLWLMCQYLGLVAFSRHQVLAVVVAGLFGVGAVVSIRTSLREATLFPALLFVFPLLYLLYFSQQRVMIVRNLMLTLPLLAAGAALGLQWIVEVAHSRRSTWLVGAALLVVFGVNQVWQLQAGLSIPRHRRWNGAIAASDFPSDKPVWASRSFNLLPSSAARVVPWQQAEVVLFQRHDFVPPAAELRLLRANRPGRYHPFPAGPHDVNLDYYPTWQGPPRPIWITRAFADEMELARHLR